MSKKICENISALQMHNLAVDEVRNLKRKLMKAVKRLGYNNHTFHEVMVLMKADPEQGFSNKPEVDEYFTSGLDRIQSKLNKIFGPHVLNEDVTSLKVRNKSISQKIS